ncbi:type II secretion system protein GspM [Methylobacterium sp. Leaf118]|uniref:type II secretion system protein GspM n=1 Tax=Methylobacterium sp. Leaf118 TaxID=2876562 RepID=UPI001E4D750A|nr:type II secretion system protein GspM [Methylobacterium sp. Leaf118]
MSRPSSETARRWLGPAALAVFVGLPLLLAAGTVSQVLAWQEAAAATEEARARIAGIEPRIRRLAAERSARNAEGAEAPSSVYLDAAAPGLARAELQRRLSALIDRAGGRLIETRGEDEADDGRSVLLRASLDIDHDGLFALLAAVEAGMPLLTVEAITIRTQQAGRGVGEEPHPGLRVALAVRGHRREGRS